MTAATTAPVRDEDDDRTPQESGDPFDRDVLPTPRAPPARCCAPCSRRCAAGWH